MLSVIKFTIVLSILMDHYESKPSNVCYRFEDYLGIAGSKNCYYNEDYDLDAPTLIKKYTGIVESHEVTTEDGFILTMFRIPRENPKGIFLLQHAMLTNCFVYILQGENSIAFYLWRNGYEVWLNNQRGTVFSRHINYTESDIEYWNWSFHEIGYFDIDSQVKYMRNFSDQKFLYYGYSLGTTTGLIYSSTRSEAAEQSFRVFIYSGVTCYYKYSTSFAIHLSKFLTILREIYKYFGIGSGFPFLHFLKSLNNMVFKTFPITIGLLYVFTLITAGNTTDEINPEYLGTDFSKVYDNFSIRTLLHYLQLVNTKTKFQMYDYGIEKNKEIYGNPYPDLYPIENITVPTYIIYSYEDILTTAKDALMLYSKLQPKAKMYGNLEVRGLNHEDLNFGKHRKEWFLDKMLQFVDNITITGSL